MYAGFFPRWTGPAFCCMAQPSCRMAAGLLGVLGQEFRNSVDGFGVGMAFRQMAYLGESDRRVRNPRGKAQTAPCHRETEHERFVVAARSGGRGACRAR